MKRSELKLKNLLLEEISMSKIKLLIMPILIKNNIKFLKVFQHEDAIWIDTSNFDRFKNKKQLLDEIINVLKVYMKDKFLSYSWIYKTIIIKSVFPEWDKSEHQSVYGHGFPGDPNKFR